MGRIISYPEITTLSDDDYLIVDNSTGGTRKISAQTVAGTIDPIPTEDSQNAVRSDGVYNALTALTEELDETQDNVYHVYPRELFMSTTGINDISSGADNIPLYSLPCDICPIMSGSGMPSRDNIRTLSARSEINIYHSNKNLIPSDMYQDSPEKILLGVDSADGLIFLKAGTYTMTVTMKDETVSVTPYWQIGETVTHGVGKTLHEDTYVSIYLYDENGIATNSVESFQLEIGNQHTTYVAHDGEKTNVVFPTDYGDIYLGSINPVLGTLEIEGIMYERNSSTMNNTEDKPGWSYTGLRAYDVKVGTFDTVHYWDDYGGGSNRQIRYTQVNVGSVYSVEYENDDYNVILPVDTYGLTQSQWISLGIDIQIIVTLQTPLVIDIPKEDIRTFLGRNIFYTDSSYFALGYRKDVESMIGDITSALRPVQIEIPDIAEGQQVTTSVTGDTLLTYIKNNRTMYLRQTVGRFNILLSYNRKYNTHGVTHVEAIGLAYYDSKLRVFIISSGNSLSDFCTVTHTVVDSDAALTKDSVMTALGYANDGSVAIATQSDAASIAADVFSTEIVKPTFLATDNMSKAVIQNAFGVDASIVTPSTITSTEVLINRLNPRTWFVWLSGTEVEFARLGVSLNATNNAITLYLHGRTSMCMGIMGVDSAWTVTAL